MAIEQRSVSFVVRLQKWTQIAVAILFASFMVLLLPGAGAFGVPLGCLYIAWAVRASSEHMFSVWFAFLFTVVLALTGGLVVARRISSLMTGQAVPRTDFSVELTLFLISATVVVLHGINWRWLLPSATRMER